MKTITKTAIIGGAGCLAAYLLFRPQKKKSQAGERSKESLIENEEIRAQFNRLPLKAHGFLAGIPIHSLDYIELRGGRPGMTTADIYRAAGLGDLDKVELGVVTKGLFGLRTLIGKVMRWDEVPDLVQAISYLPRLSAEERAESLIPSGEVSGISRVLYCYDKEMLLEIINKTVHCFWVLASVETPVGYDLYNAVYVKRLNWRTPVYMTLVSPVLKRVIYPAIDKSIEHNWELNFPAESEKRNEKILTV